MPFRAVGTICKSRCKYHSFRFTLSSKNLHIILNYTVEITLCTVGIKLRVECIINAFLRLQESDSSTIHEIKTLSTQAYEAGRSDAQAKKSIL